MKTVAVIQARLGSTRLPGKVLYEIGGRPMLCFIIERVRRTPGIDQIVLATGDTDANDALANTVADFGVNVVRGSEDDVLARYRKAAEETNADVIVRVTGDCPFVDPKVLQALLDLRSHGRFDYATNVKPETWPDGLDASVFTYETLVTADHEARLPSEREHVVPWMWKNSGLEGGTRLTSANLEAPEDMSALRWTVDDALDFRLVRAIVRDMGADAALAADWEDILECFRAQPASLLANQSTQRDEGYLKSLVQDGVGR